MKPPLFEYVKPETVAEALGYIEEDDGTMIVAGGQSLIPAMNMRLANPPRLVDIQNLPGLDNLSVIDGVISVGAMVRHRDMELSDEVYAANPIFREALAHVAHVPVRHRGTVVGSLCHADAAAEMPMLLVLTGGEVVAQGQSGTRTIPASEFFTFHMTTARQPNEIITEVRFAALPEDAGCAFEEFIRRHGDFALSAVGTIINVGSGGLVEQISIAACGISSTPVRLSEAEDILRGSGLSDADLDAAASATFAAVTGDDDLHATKAYRQHLTATLLRKSVKRAAARATGGN